MRSSSTLRLLRLLPLILAAPACQTSEPLPRPIDVAAARVSRWRETESVHATAVLAGVPVRASGTVVHRRPGRADWAVTIQQPEITVDPRPRLTASEAAERLAATLAIPVRGPINAELVIVPTARGGELRYEAVVTTTQPLATWRLAIDAHDGTALPPVRLAVQARGRVYPVSPAHGDPEIVELTDLAGDGSLLVGSRADVTSADFDTRFAAADEMGDFLYEPDAAPDAFAEVNAYHHLTKIAAQLEAEHGFTLGEPVLVVVNADELDNAEAFTLGDGTPVVRLGQTATRDWAYDAPTIAHELGHHLFDQRNDISDANDYPINSDAYGFHPAPQALNEAASDYWGATLYAEPDVALSEGSLDYNPRALDSGLRCPDDVWGEAHLDAAIVSGTFWDIREAIGAELADELVYALLGAVSDSPTFAEIAQILLDHAESLDDPVTAAVRQAIDVHGLSVCGRSVAITEGDTFETHLAGAEAAALLAGIDGDLCATLRQGGIRVPLPFQLELADPGEPVEALRVEIAMVRQDGQPVEEGDLSYALLIRRGDLITFDVTSLPLGDSAIDLPTEPVDVDLVFEDSPTSLEIPAAELGEGPYYLDILALNCFSVGVEMSVEWIRPEPEAAADVGTVPDADVGPEPSADDGDGGCQLVTSRRGAPVAWLILGFWIVVGWPSLRSWRKQRGD